MKELFSELGKRGGKARAEALSGKQRKQIAMKAEKASAKVRSAKAKARRAK